MTPTADPVLITERLRLRPLRTSDAEALSRYRSDPATARYQSWSTPYTLQDATTLIDDLNDNDPTTPGWFQYGIVLSRTDELIGDLGVNLAENRRLAEIGFTLAAEQQGHGYGLEAVRRMLDHLFTDRGLHGWSPSAMPAIWRPPGCWNGPDSGSRDICREHTYMKGEWTDDLLFGLLAREWPARQ